MFSITESRTGSISFPRKKLLSYCDFIAARMKAKVVASVLTIILFTSATVLFSSPTQTNAQKDNCDSSYPDVCIPPSPPDRLY